MYLAKHSSICHDAATNSVAIPSESGHPLEPEGNVTKPIPSLLVAIPSESGHPLERTQCSGELHDCRNVAIPSESGHPLEP